MDVLRRWNWKCANLGCQLLSAFVVARRQAQLDTNAIRSLDVIRKPNTRQIEILAARRASMTH